MICARVCEQTTTHVLFFKHQGKGVVLKHNAASGHWWFGDYDNNGSCSWYSRNDWAAGYTTHLAACEIDGEAILLQHSNNSGGWHWGRYDGKGSVNWYGANEWQAKVRPRRLEC